MPLAIPVGIMAPMPERVLILGGGTGGAVAARRLSQWAKPGEVEVTLVDRSPWHEYRPSYLWVMTGRREPDEVRRPLATLESLWGTKVVQAEVVSIDPDARRVETDSGTIEYDSLIVSLGSVLADDAMLAGLDAPWELDASVRLHERLRGYEGGRVLVGPVSWPYRCPPAPFEVAFMLRYLAEQRGFADRTEVTVFHPWTEPMETFGPLMVRGFRQFLDQFDVGFAGGFELADHDAGKHVLVGGDGRELPYDFAVVIPAHAPPAPVAESPLAAPGGYMDVELPSMRSPRYDTVYGIGDVVAPTIGLGMAGVFAHFQAEHVASQILDRIRGAFVGELYNMVGVCVMDTGYMGAAVWCDFTDKLFGRSPHPDCRMLGGMRAFRAVKVAYERYWFAHLFGG
jgi:sulfide:quinone oxidoreductase